MLKPQINVADKLNKFNEQTDKQTQQCIYMVRLDSKIA